MPAANRNNSAPRGDGHLIQLSPERIDAQFIRRVLSMYDGEAKGSIKDLRLDRNEIDLPEDLFASADADRDGYWDFDELGRFLRRPAATVEILVHQAEPEGDAITTGAAGSRSLVELSMAGENGTRMQTALPGLLKFEIHGVRFHLKVLPPARNAGEDETLTAQFRALDADKNEYLELKEFNSAGDEQSQAFFRAIDADGDEKVYLAEFLAYNRLAAQIRSSQQVLTVENLGRTLFGPLDANGDGQLSQRELANLKSRFPEWDLDGDGKLVETEIPQQYRLALTSGAGGLFGVNGTLAGIVEFDNGEGNVSTLPPAGAPKWFLKMDRNRDGEVSAREFLGTTERFQKIDANADGAIDAAEAAAVK
jgi:Ca2+-binding EF-hand superfamily protein